MTELENKFEKREDQIVMFDGPVWYRWRRFGLEEGSHAVYFVVKPDKISSSLAGVAEIDDRFSGKMPHVMRYTVPITLFNRKDYVDILDHFDPNSQIFKGEKLTRAMGLLYYLVQGALVPINKILPREKANQISLGIMKFDPGNKAPNAFYEPIEKMIVINSKVLMSDSEFNPQDNIVLWSYANLSKMQKYLNQDHEKRSLSWILEDAKEMKMEKQIEDTRRLLKIANSV